MANAIVKENTTGTGLMKRLKSTLTAKPESSSQVLAIDYPQEGEQVHEGEYSIRISAKPEAEVEISINNGEWQPCRASVGYWWFDWQPVETTRCELVTRARIGKGRWKKSEARSCRIVNSDQP